MQLMTWVRRAIEAPDAQVAAAIMTQPHWLCRRLPPPLRGLVLGCSCHLETLRLVSLVQG